MSGCHRYQRPLEATSRYMLQLYLEVASRGTFVLHSVLKIRRQVDKNSIEDPYQRAPNYRTQITRRISRGPRVDPHSESPHHLTSQKSPREAQLHPQPCAYARPPRSPHAPSSSPATRDRKRRRTRRSCPLPTARPRARRRAACRVWGGRAGG